jgi:hypothetical protein
MTDIPREDADLLAAEIHVPDHVAVREFDGESVALNLQSGNYFGLNSVAAQMFERLRTVHVAEETVDALAQEYGQEREVIERDLVELMRGLIERGLIALGGPPPPKA